MLKRSFLAILLVLLFSGAALAQASQSLDLKAGFNFIAFTVKPSVNAVQFKGLNAAIEEVYSFSAASGSFLSVSEGTLNTLSAGKGYIVKAASPVSLNVSGEAVQTVGTINLKAGFNLVGVSKAVTAQKFSDLIKSNSAVRGLYRYSAASGSFIQVVKGLSGLADLRDGVDPSFSAGQSYFFDVESDTTLNYDGGTLTMSGSTTVPASGFTYVNAINGALTLAFNPALATAASFIDFTISRSVDGGATFAAVAPISVKGGQGADVVITLPMTPAGASAIDLKYRVAYKNNPALDSAVIVVPAVDNTTAAFNFVSVANGSITLSFTPALAAAPSAADFTVSQTIDDGANFTPLVPASVTGGAGSNVTIMVPSSNSGASVLGLKYRVSYKNGAPKISQAVVMSVMTISSVTNGVINVNISPAPVVTPAVSNFIVKQKDVNAMREDPITPVSVNATASASDFVINVPAAVQKTTAQKLAYVVSYMGGQFVTSSTFDVSASGGTVPPPSGSLSIAFDKQGGNYPSANLDVNLTASPSGAFVWYTNDGTDPRTSNTVITATVAGYPVRVIITAGRTAYTIKAVATLNGQFSEVVSNTYSTTGSGSTAVTVHMPLIAPMDVLTLGANDTVTLTPDPADYAIYNTIKIRYTTDGTEPTVSSPEYVIGVTEIKPAAGVSTFTVKAIAVSGAAVSPVSSKTFAVTQNSGQ